jgi:hypothetical protein
MKFECSCKIKASLIVASICDLFLHFALRFFAPSQLHNTIETTQVPPSLLHMGGAE